MKLTMPSIHYLALLPILIFFGAALLLMGISALRSRRLATSAATVTTVLACVAVLVVNFVQWSYVDHHGPTTTVAHALVLDGFAVVATSVIAFAMLLSALVAHDWAIRERVTGVDYHVLALAASAGAMVMAQANDLVVIFLGLEI
ncbi:MAG TPA: hypothetical protein PLG60_04595, partial [Acidimicrobiales bacterium]|nr:hypothetical protein [Acidimicrobiales bacterium]